MWNMTRPEAGQHPGQCRRASEARANGRAVREFGELIKAAPSLPPAEHANHSGRSWHQGLFRASRRDTEWQNGNEAVLLSHQGGHHQSGVINRE
jgi:hypothetical protein